MAEMFTCKEYATRRCKLTHDNGRIGDNSAHACLFCGGAMHAICGSPPTEQEYEAWAPYAPREGSGSKRICSSCNTERSPSVRKVVDEIPASPKRKQVGNHLPTTPQAPNTPGKESSDSGNVNSMLKVKCQSDSSKEVTDADPGETGPETQERLRLYSLFKSFFNDMNVQEQRRFARAHRVKQHTSKYGFVANLMVWLKEKVEDNQDFSKILTEDYTERFKVFQKRWELQNPLNGPLETPDWDDLYKNATMYKNRAGRPSTPVAELAPYFSSNEFARLVALLLEDEKVRSGLVASLQEPIKREQELETDGDLFWANVVAEKFNDANYHPLLDVSDHCTDVDSSIAPSVERSGPFLKHQFLAVRKVFSFCFDLWNRANQNDSNSFKQYLPSGISPSQVSVDGEKSLILFSALRCGTPFQDTSIVETVVRATGTKSPGFDLGKVGCKQINRNAEFLKRRRHSAHGPVSDSEAVCSTAVQDVVEFAKAQLRRRTPSPDKEEMEIRRKQRRMDHELHRFKHASELLDLLNKASNMLREGFDDPNLKKAAQLQYEAGWSLFKKYHGNSNNGDEDVDNDNPET